MIFQSEAFEQPAEVPADVPADGGGQELGTTFTATPAAAPTQYTQLPRDKFASNLVRSRPQSWHQCLSDRPHHIWSM